MHRKHLKTKIVCTVGPSSYSTSVLNSLLENGMNCLRINSAFCPYSIISALRSCPHPNAACIPILLDINGPKLRVSFVSKKGQLAVTLGQTYTFLSSNPTSLGNRNAVISNLCDYVKAGDFLLIADGELTFKIVQIDDDGAVQCLAQSSGVIEEHKSVSVSTLQKRHDYYSVSDALLEDINFAIQNDIDFICLSCITSAEDVIAVKEMLLDEKIKVLSKIETKNSLSDFDRILSVSDGIVFDRGFLAVELDVSKMPSIQRIVINSCLITGKPILLAGQILTSMHDNTIPNRSEVSDLFNCVQHSVDGFILSSETAVGMRQLELIIGPDPTLTVQWLSKICRDAEQQVDHQAIQAYITRTLGHPLGVSESIASSTGNVLLYLLVKCAKEIGSPFIFVSTEGGGMARLIAKYRPEAFIIVSAANIKTIKQLFISYGVVPRFERSCDSAKHNEQIASFIKEFNIASPTRVVKASGQTEGFVDGSSTYMQIVPA